MRPVIVTTVHKGVFFGYAEKTDGPQVVLENARMAIYWGTTRGILELSDTGPTSKSKISAVAPRIELRDITAVMDVSPEAEKAWKAA
jgi:hypothetical protein